MNREEIAARIRLGSCTQRYLSVVDSLKIADWHISEIAAAEKRGERRGRREVANIAFDLVYQEDRENQEVIDYLQETIAANSDHISDAGEMIGGN